MVHYKNCVMLSDKKSLMKLLFFLLIFLLIMQSTAMDAEAQQKITGPWLWMIAPTPPGQGGAASTDVDSLAVASGGSVTEASIATNGANVGEAVGPLVWTLGEISETGGNNVNDVVNKIGLGRGDINDYSAYALITLESRRAQRVLMRVGSDDSIKVWLNGDVVHRNAIDRGAGDFQDTFQVDLKQGDNLLLVKVSERGGGWSMFVGVNADVNAVYKPSRGNPIGGGARTVVSVAPSSITSPRIGQQFTVNVKIVGGKNVAGYQLTLRFDRTALRYVRGANADYLVRPFVTPEVVTANQVTLSATSLGVLSQGDGTLATLTFEVLAVKASMLTLTNVIIVNAQGTPVPVHIESGQVNPPAIDAPERVSIQLTPNAYISSNNVVEPKGGNFSGVIPLTFTVWSKTNTRMRNQTMRLTTILWLLNRKEGIALREPWRSAWRIIEESWNNPIVRYDLRRNEYIVKDRISSGERSDSLVSAIVDLVAPRLVLKPYGTKERQLYKIPKRPRTFHHLFRASSSCGKTIDPSFLELDRLTDGEFIRSLANALDATVVRGLDIARRTGRGKVHIFLRRVYHVSETERREETYEPDEFGKNIAPPVKLLYAVVLRLLDVNSSAARGFVSRWNRKDSPIHLRLWAAMSRDPRVTSAKEVGDFLLRLNYRLFWDVHHHPEITELRARRFSELGHPTQKRVTKRIRKGPPRRFWPEMRILTELMRLVYIGLFANLNGLKLPEEGCHKRTGFGLKRTLSGSPV